MDDRAKIFFVTGSVILILFISIIAAVYFLLSGLKPFQKKSGQLSQTPASLPAESSPATTAEPVPSVEPAPQNIEIKDENTLTIDGIQLHYPKNWGVLACKNSNNFEFDPENAKDEETVCSYAAKPVTVLVGERKNCPGEDVELGNVKVVRSKSNTSVGIQYKWCVKTSPVLEITHRVSSQVSRAYSQKDFSAAVEKIISSILFGAAS